MRKLIYSLGICGVILLYGCANQLALTGGPKDESPPMLDEEQSTPNEQTQFDLRAIELYFDEYINLQNAAKQIVISPPLEYSPKIKSRLKKISLSLDPNEVLREDVTYVINFGNAIKDFTEGNILDNYTFVFSTGDYIDSLTINGIVKDAISEEPVKDILVALYQSEEDSIIYKERPFFFAKTVDGGRFNIKNLAANSYKIVAFSDENGDYLYNPESEKIAFLDTMVVASDSTDTALDLFLFEEEQTIEYISYEPKAKGVLQLKFNGPAQDSLIRVLDTIETYFHTKENHEILEIWYTPLTRSSLRFEAKRTSGLDTINARINQRSTDTLSQPYDIVSYNNNSGAGIIPSQPLSIKMNRPTKAFDPNLVTLVDTTAKDTFSLSLTSDLPNMELEFDISMDSARSMILTALPGGFVDFFNKTNDTLTRDISWADESKFGSMILTFQKDYKKQYIVELLKSKKILRKIILEEQDTLINFQHLTPGKYKLEVIEDINANGKWDTGSYLEKTKSEKIIKYDLEDLRANWTLESSINLKSDNIFSLHINEGDSFSDSLTTAYDEPPLFGGCSTRRCSEKTLLRYAYQNVVYPTQAMENKTEGKVYASFIIDTNGRVSDVEILRSLSPSTDRAAIAMINSMNELPLDQRWQPASLAGITIQTKYILPITFKLEN